MRQLCFIMSISMQLEEAIPFRYTEGQIRRKERGTVVIFRNCVYACVLLG
jgi:hypothetical protein